MRGDGDGDNRGDEDDDAATAGPPTVGLSRAHRRSLPFVIDPDYRTTAPHPRPEHEGGGSGGKRVSFWLYGESECETYRLAVLRRRVREAKLNAYYPGEYALPSRRAHFRAEVSDLLHQVGDDVGNDARAVGGRFVVRMVSNARGIVRLVRDDNGEEEETGSGVIVHEYGSSNGIGEVEEFEFQINVDMDMEVRSSSCSAAGRTGGDGNGTSSGVFAVIELETETLEGEGEGEGDDIPEPPCLSIAVKSPTATVSTEKTSLSSSQSSLMPRDDDDRQRRAAAEKCWHWSADGVQWTRTTAAAAASWHASSHLPPFSPRVGCSSGRRGAGKDDDEFASPSCPLLPPYPHRIEASPEIRLEPHEVHDVSGAIGDAGYRCGGSKKILYDFGVELFGTVFIDADADADAADANDNNNDSDSSPKLSLCVGESKAEAMNDDLELFEQSTELIQIPLDDGDGGDGRGDANPDEGGGGGEGDSNKDETGGRRAKEFKRRRRYRSRFPLAFRYVCLAVRKSAYGHRPPDVSVSAQFHPVLYRGAFFSQSRPQLNRIWMSSAYTLRMCCTSGGAFVLDGIKRDRLPWAGDLAVSLLVNRVTFADADIVRRTLTVLGRAGIRKKHVNGIVDYSLWLIVCHELFQVHYGADVDYLEKEWTRIRDALTVLMDRSGDEGGLLELKVKPPPGDESEEGEGACGEDYDWLFIDWSIQDDRRKVTSVQILFWWALRCGAALASRRRHWLVDTDAGDANADDDHEAFVTRLERHRDGVRTHLLDVCYHDEAGLWLASPPPSPSSSSSSSTLAADADGLCYSRHASILAVVSGLMMVPPSLSPESKRSLRDALLGIGGGGTGHRLEDDDVVGTPYFKYWECAALFRLGATAEALDVVEKYWGGMLKSGATTFWEAYGPSKEGGGGHTEMYARPYGRSLCHAWGAGPCHLLSAELLGLRPLTDGYGDWTIRYPLLLDEAVVVEAVAGLSVAIPSPKGGTIEIASVQGDDDALFLEIKVPDATSLVLGDGRRFVGPTVVSLPLPGVIDGGGNDYDGGGAISDNDVRRYSAEFRGWYYHPDFVIPPSPKIEGFDDITMTDVPTIFRLPDDGDDAYYMAFVGFDGGGYQSFVARSTDLIHWDDIRLAMRRSDIVDDFDHGGVVLGGFLYEDYKLRGRRTLKRIDDKFWALYGCYSKRGGYEIDPGYEGIASSVDGLFWERAMDRPILSVHDPDVGSWEKTSIYQPWLMEHGDGGGQYYNFYNAKTLDPQWTEQIGLATSSDMKKWERHKANPVLRVRPGGYDSRFAADPKVWHDDGEEEKFAMLYFGVDDTWHAHIMIAYSRDLQHGGCWRADPKPLYRAGGNPSGIDGEHAHKASLIWNEADETWYLLYCAVGDRGRGIGLITSRPSSHLGLKK